MKTSKPTWDDERLCWNYGASGVDGDDEPAGAFIKKSVDTCNVCYQSHSYIRAYGCLACASRFAIFMSDEPELTAPSDDEGDDYHDYDDNDDDDEGEGDGGYSGGYPDYVADSDDDNPYFKCGFCGENYLDNWQGDCDECTLLNEIYANDD